MDRKLMAEIWYAHNGKILGMLIGFIVSVLIVLLGFFQTVFIALCVTLGYLVGKRIDANERFPDILEKILPPDYHR